MSYGEPACLWLIIPRGFYADGSRTKILDPDGGAGRVCLCLTDEEYDGLGERLSRRGFPEPGTLLEEFNELAYEECKLLASFEDFVDDECLEYYEAGEWLKDIYWSEPPFDNGTPPGFTCIDE
ncbi:MAG: hypothetical protein AAGF11_21790 [Myxococcota bacterium]